MIAEAGLSKNDLLLNSISGKNATIRFISICIIVFGVFLFIFSIWVRQVFEKYSDSDDVNISTKNHINTVRFSIEFINSITCIFLSIM